jgi:thiazole synthase ThiGH ThiG subunit
MPLAAPIGSADTSILVEAIAFAPAELVGVHVMIDDGIASPRLVTAAVAEGQNHRLTVAPLGRSIASAKIRRMRLVRLDSDVVEISHRMGFYSSVRLPLIEVTE